MAKDNNHIINFNASDIEKYHKGLLSAAERHQMEKAALEDPFLADALEGYAFAGDQLPSDLSELSQKITKAASAGKVVAMQPVKKTFSPLLRVAAMFILIAGAGLLVYHFAFNKKDAEIAKNEPAPKEETVTVTKRADSLPVNPNTAGEKTVTPAQPVITEEFKTKDAPAPVAATENKPLDRGTVKSSTDDLDKASSSTNPVIGNTDTRSASGGKPQPAVAPGAVTKNIEDKEFVKQQKDQTELAREESKAKAVPLKKQEAGIVARQQVDEKNLKSNNRQQNLDGYYNAQAMRTFRGRVTDPNNVGLPFANVTNLRDNVGTYTDANGNFILTSTDTILDVQIRSIGYENNNIQLRSDIGANKIALQEDVQTLSEQVVVAQKPNTAARSKDGTRKLIEPEPVDGWVKYDSYLANNLNIPEEYRQQNNNNSNSVELSFEVDKNGEPVNIRVEKSLCSSCDKEAIRLVKEGPKFKRTASKKGRTRVTINF